LPRSALVSLIEAQAQWDENARADFAPCCMAFCKAVEISLFDLFQKFRGDIAAQPNFPAMLAQGGDPEFQKAQAFVRFLVKGSPLELGTTAFVLKLCLGNTGKNLAMLGALKQWLEASNCHALLKTETTDVISRLAAKYRNPAAHSDPFDRNTVNEARKLCFSLLKDLPISEGSPST